MSTSLDIKDLTVRIPLRDGKVVHAATQVDLSVARGEVHAVVGESGCGKSIVAAAVTGSLPPHARTSGNVRYFPETGEPIEILQRRWLSRMLAPTDRQLAGREIALVPQSAATFLTPVRTVGAQLAETIAALDAAVSPAELFERVHLDASVGTLYPHQLSGGMAQRAAIAFALVGDPSLVVADEPTAALDPELTMQILQLLRSIADDGAGVLVITHDLSELMDSQVADTLSVMYASRIEESGAAATLLAHPGGAYLRDLLQALPENGMHPMPGSVPILTDLPDDYCYEKRLAAAGEGAHD